MRQDEGSALAVEEPRPQVDGRLAVREEAAFLVGRVEDPDDWPVRFSRRTPAFRPASGPRTWSASTTGAS